MNQVSYQPSYCEEVLQFFGGPAFHVTEVQKKDGTITLLETAAELPTFEAFAQKIGVTCADLRAWESQYPAFKYACEQARDRQGNLLIQNSLRGNYSATFAVFMAKNVLGWQESKDKKSDPNDFTLVWEDGNEH